MKKLTGVGETKKKEPDVSMKRVKKTRKDLNKFQQKKKSDEGRMREGVEDIARGGHRADQGRGVLEWRERGESRSERRKGKKLWHVYSGIKKFST